MKLPLSKKYTMTCLGVIALFLTLPLIKGLEFPEKTELYVMLSTQLSIVILTITYLTGQAKLDLTLKSGFEIDEE